MSVIYRCDECGKEEEGRYFKAHPKRRLAPYGWYIFTGQIRATDLCGRHCARDWMDNAKKQFEEATKSGSAISGESSESLQHGQD